MATNGHEDSVVVWTSQPSGPDVVLENASAVVAWSPEGKRLAAVGNTDKPSVKIVDVKTGTELDTYSPPFAEGWQSSLAWKPDASVVCSAYWLTPGERRKGAGQIVALDVDANKILFNRRSDAIWSIAWTTDGKYFATGEDGVVAVRKGRTGEVVRQLEGHADRVGSLAFSPNGKWLATSCYDQEVKLWDTSTWQEVRSFRKHAKAFGGDGQFSIAWSSSSDRIAGSSCVGLIIVWKVTGEEIFRRHGHGTNAWCVGWSPDGTRLVSSGEDQVVKVWDAKDGTELLAFVEPVPTGCIAWSPDGKQLAYEANNSTIKIRDASMAYQNQNLPRPGTD